MLAIGVLGFFLERHQFPLAPVVLGFVMGPLLEENLRRALLLDQGSMTSFLTRPYAAIFTLVCFTVVALGAWRQIILGRNKMQQKVL
jgi:putative tricarboxylic transport membrane protein